MSNRRAGRAGYSNPGAVAGIALDVRDAAAWPAPARRSDRDEIHCIGGRSLCATPVTSGTVGGAAAGSRSLTQPVASGPSTALKDTSPQK